MQPKGSRSCRPVLILLILLPGFAAYIVQTLALRGPQTELDKVVEACLYSFLIYSIFIFVTSGRLPFETVSSSTASGGETILWHPKMLIALTAITLVFAFAVAAFTNLDGIRIFRKLKITERTTRNSIWNDSFQQEAKRVQVVQVEVEGGRSILGLLTYYSDAAEDCSVYIEQASWVDDEGNLVPISGPGILLTKNANIKSVSLLDN